MWSIERRRFEWPWTTPDQVFKVTLFFDADISFTVKDTAIVTMEGEQETEPKLSNGTN